VTPHEVAALRLLAESEPAMRGRSDRMLAAAQVHATLAVEAAVRELIEETLARERERIALAIEAEAEAKWRDVYDNADKAFEMAARVARIPRP
jgi:uncharacterized iron-regulated protein